MEQIITATESERQLSAQERAIQLTQRIKANGAIAANAIVEIGKDLRIVKIEELYKTMGYETFEEYTLSEFDIKSRQAQTYISTYEKLGEEFMQSNAQLGITRLSCLATANPEDREEILQNHDVANMSVKDLQKLIDENKIKGEQLSLLQGENIKLEERIAELENKPQDVAIKEVPDQKTVKELAAAKAELKKAEKELRSVTAEAEMYKKSAESARIEAKKVKDNAELEAEKAAKAEIEKSQKMLEARVRKAEQEKGNLERQVAELKAAAAKPPEEEDKKDFKNILTSTYKEISGLVAFIKGTEDAEKRKLYIVKALEIINACKDSITEIQLPVNIDEQSSKSRGVIDIGSIPPITSSRDEEGDDE